MQKSSFHFSGNRAFTLVEILIVVATIAIIIGIAVPAFLNARIQAREKICRENQEDLSGAIQRYAMSTNSDTPPTYDNLLHAEYLMKTARCPTTNREIIIPASLNVLPKCPTDEPRHTIDPKN